MTDIMDFFEAKDLLEAATPENPVKMRLSDGAGQHIDILVFEATVSIGPHSDEDFTAYEEEKAANREEATAVERIRRFRLAAEQIGLGKAKVEELLNATN